MTREEFTEIYHDMTDNLCQLGGLPISDEDYKIIEFVYAYHPSISETHGKEQIVYLYKTYGMAIINDMYPRAKIAQEYEKCTMTLRHQMEEQESLNLQLKIGTSDYDLRDLRQELGIML